MHPQTPSQQRDKMVGDLRLRKNPEGLSEATERLQAYLREHHLRKTPERLFVLRKVYQLSGPVDIETLHSLLEMEHNIVSLQTIYNTLGLLTEIGLVNRVQLIQGGMAFYERALHQEPHGYMVCRKCCRVTLLRRPRLMDDLRADLPSAFRIEQVAFSVFGLCRKCQLSERKAQLRELRKKEPPTPASKALPSDGQASATPRPRYIRSGRNEDNNNIKHTQ